MNFPTLIIKIKETEYINNKAISIFVFLFNNKKIQELTNKAIDVCLK